MATSARDSRGMVTAETAAVLPVLLSVTVALVWLVGVGIAHVRCVDAARDAARALARAESVAEARRLAAEVAPTGATVAISRAGNVAQVQVSYRATLPGQLLDEVVTIDLAATSRMPVETA